MLLNLNTEVGQSRLLVLQAAQDNRIFWFQFSGDFFVDLDFNSQVGPNLEVTKLFT